MVNFKSKVKVTICVIFKLHIQSVYVRNFNKDSLALFEAFGFAKPVNFMSTMIVEKPPSRFFFKFLNFIPCERQMGCNSAYLF